MPFPIISIILFRTTILAIYVDFCALLLLLLPYYYLFYYNRIIIVVVVIILLYRHALRGEWPLVFIVFYFTHRASQGSHFSMFFSHPLRRVRCFGLVPLLWFSAPHRDGRSFLCVAVCLSHPALVPPCQGAGGGLGFPIFPCKHP